MKFATNIQFGIPKQLLFLKPDKLYSKHLRGPPSPVFVSLCVYLCGLCQSTYTQHLVPIISLNSSLSGTEAIC